MKRTAIATILALTALAIALSLWQAVSPYITHTFWGISFAIDTGRTTRVFPDELPPGVHIERGDRVVERPNGDPLRGYRLYIPEAGDVVHVTTANGTVTMHAAPHTYPPSDAIVETLRHLTGAVVIAFAGLLFARRPGVMAFAFWLSAIYGLGGGDLNFALDRLPRTAGFAISMLFQLLGYSGFALVSFALRFPTGQVPERWRRLDRGVWIALGVAGIYELIVELVYFAGLRPVGRTDITASALPVLAAAAVFVIKQSRADPLERSRIAWASAAFVTSAGFRALALAPVFGDGSILDWRLLQAMSNFCLLLAIYPVLRYRLFDLGFVVNRAALYSTLTLAAFGTLAAANWIAQHFVTDRLAFVLQPVAAIAIGLGYFRVRAWVQRGLERLLFRERMAAEEFIETLIRTLPFAERAQTVDDVLVAEVTRALRLSSAALFRANGDGFQRQAVLNWGEPLSARIASDDIVARSILAGDGLVQLEALRWQPADLPPPPAEPVIALGIVRRGTLAAIVLYGRHANGTELEPHELQLLRRLADAAAVAYETVDVFALREQNEFLERRLRLLEAAGTRFTA